MCNKLNKKQELAIELVMEGKTNSRIAESAGAAY
jgi:DNA-binding CsgD family transcriptional regulator